MAYYSLTITNLAERIPGQFAIIRMDSNDDRVPRRAIDALREGRVVAFPTDTVYGVGCRIDEDRAVRRIFALKSRPLTDPLPILLADANQLDEVASRVPEAARKLIERFWPGPLTIVVARSPRVPSLVASGGDTVAVRLPNHRVPRALVRAVGIPIVGTSANSHGARAPLTAQQVVFDLGDQIDLVLDEGRTPLGVESTVVDVTGPSLRVVREGAIPAAEVLAVGGQAQVVVEVRGRP